MKTDRVLNILYYLNRYKKVSAKKLSEEFEVSQRTVYRDLDILENMGIPIERKQGIEGGISIIETFKLENINFSKSELSRIISILSNHYYKDSKTKLSIEKLKNIISDVDLEEQKKLDYFKIEKNDYMNDKEKEKISVLKKAIENKNVIKINYMNSNAERSIRELEPYVISFKGHTVYLMGYCLLREELRIFKLSRMKELEITNKKFQFKNEILDEIYSQKEFFKFYDDNKDENIVLKFQKNFFDEIENIFDKYEVLDNKAFSMKNENSEISIHESDVLIKIRWKIDRWFFSFILGFGKMVEVIEPKELREKIIKEIEQMSLVYKTG